MRVPGLGASRSDLQTLILLHIPRTGGTTLNHLLTREFLTSEIFKVDGSKIGAALDSLAEMSTTDRSHLRFVSGHIDYGVHELLAAPSQYITLTREPVSRLVSCYGQMYRMPGHRLHSAVRQGVISFEDYLRSGIDLQTDNGQVRQIAGCLFSLEFGACKRSHLALAKEHIENHFLLAGTTEAYDEGLVMLAAFLGLQRITSIPRNSNGRFNKVAEISNPLRQEVIERNYLDMELHEFVSSRLHQAFQSDPSFSEALLQFRKVERRLQALTPARRVRDNLASHYRAFRRS